MDAINTQVELIRTVAAQTLRWKFRIWGFGEAIALRGLYQAASVTGDSSFRDHVDALLEVYVNRGVGMSAEEHIAPGSELLVLYQRTGEERYLQRSAEARGIAFLVFNWQLGRAHTPSRFTGVASSDLGGLHGCGAAIPCFARQVTGDGKWFDQAASEILGYARLLQDEETGLFFHGFEEACGRNGQIWARGNGWALMGLVEVLKLLPKEHSHYDELSERLVRACRALARYQHSSGLWHTVVVNPDTYLESTLAVMTAYSLREAFKAELIDESEFREVEQQARAASLRLITEDGALDLVTDATPVAELKMYATRPFGIYPWGQGPLLLMLTQS